GAPCRTRGASVAARWLPCEATYPMASTRFVFPCPFGPTKAVTPGSSATSAAGYERKSCRERWATCTRHERRAFHSRTAHTPASVPGVPAVHKPGGDRSPRDDGSANVDTSADGGAGNAPRAAEQPGA